MQEPGGASDPEESLPRFLAKKSEERWKSVEQKRLAFTKSFSQEVRNFSAFLIRLVFRTAGITLYSKQSFIILIRRSGATGVKHLLLFAPA